MTDGAMSYICMLKDPPRCCGRLMADGHNREETRLFALLQRVFVARRSGVMFAALCIGLPPFLYLSYRCMMVCTLRRCRENGRKRSSGIS